MPKKFTNEDIDKKLIDRNIKRLDNYLGFFISIHFQCLKCYYGHNNEWKTSIRSIVLDRTGCPKCAGLAKLSNKDVDGKRNYSKSIDI